MSGASLTGMMVVVPALSVGQQGDKPAIPAVIACLVAPVSPKMRHGIHHPGDVPDEDRSYDDAPDKNTEAELQGTPGRRRHDPSGQKADSEEAQGMGQVDPEPESVPFQAGVESVL